MVLASDFRSAILQEIPRYVVRLSVSVVFHVSNEVSVRQESLNNVLFKHIVAARFFLLSNFFFPHFIVIHLQIGFF